MDKVYFYGMRLRPFGLGCQPIKGLLDWAEDKHEHYHNILIYERELTEKEISNYELDFIDKVDYPKTFKKWYNYLSKELSEAEEGLIKDYVNTAIWEGIRDVMIVYEWLVDELN